MIYRKPERIFESTGHVNPEEAYYIQLENVTNSRKQDIKTMVDRGRYFSIFAPKQSGKTTFLKTICSQLHEDPVYVVIILSFRIWCQAKNKKNNYQPGVPDNSRRPSLLSPYFISLTGC